MWKSSVPPETVTPPTQFRRVFPDKFLSDPVTLILISCGDISGITFQVECGWHLPFGDRLHRKHQGYTPALGMVGGSGKRHFLFPAGRYFFFLFFMPERYKANVSFPTQQGGPTQQGEGHPTINIGMSHISTALPPCHPEVFSEHIGHRSLRLLVFCLCSLCTK